MIFTNGQRTGRGDAAALVTSVLIQGIGTVSLFGLVILISRVGGPQAQGLFATIKSWTDLLITIGLLGLPQGFVYAINRGYAAPRPLFKLSTAYALIFGTLASAATFLAALSGYFGAPNFSPPLLLTFCLGINVSGMVFHNLVRALLLTRTDGIWFALFTIISPVFLSLAVGVAFFLIPNGSIAPAFALAGLICYLIALLAGDAATYGSVKSRGINYRILIGQSASSFTVTVLIVVQPVLTIVLMKWWSADNHVIGLFNVASMAMMVSNVLFAMISPILFNRWSKSLTFADARVLFQRMLKWGLSVAFLSLLIILIIPFAIAPIFGRAFDDAVFAAQVLGFGLAPVFYNRIASSALLGLGLAHWNAMIAGARISTVVVIFICCALLSMNPLLAAAVAWCVAEWLAAVLTHGLMAKRTQ